jgi:sucrose phosphorylase
LLLHALHFGTSEYLTAWAQSLRVLPDNCTYFNFTASHDGIGLRPATGLLPGQSLGNLIAAMYAYGGQVSMRSNQDGSTSPYEINIALFDAFRGTCQGSDQWQAQRFLCSQTIMLALQGVPALYIHSLFATPNYQDGVEQTGQPRTINRRKWDYDSLHSLLRDPNSVQFTVFNALSRLLKLRRAQPAFHPNARQRILAITPAIFAVWREAQLAEQKILALSNVTNDSQTVDISHWITNPTAWQDLIAGRFLTSDHVLLQPYQSVWLSWRAEELSH